MRGKGAFALPPADSANGTKTLYSNQLQRQKVRQRAPFVVSECKGRRNIRQNRMIEQNPPAGTAIASAALLAESNHRIANNLAVVAGYLILQANRTVREGGPIAACEVHSILAAASAKVSAAGDLHRLLSSSFDGVVDLGEYLGRVARSSIGAMTDARQFELEMEFEPGCVIEADQALNLGLLVGELIINAIKHSHPAGSSASPTASSR